MESQIEKVTVADALRVAKERAAVLRLALDGLSRSHPEDFPQDLQALMATADDLCVVLGYAVNIESRSALQMGFRHGHAGLLVAGPSKDDEVH